MIDLDLISTNQNVLQSEFDTMIAKHLSEITVLLDKKEFELGYDQFVRLYWDITFVITGMYFLSSPTSIIKPEHMDRIWQLHNQLLLSFRSQIETINTTKNTAKMYELYLRLYKIALYELFDQSLSIQEMDDILLGVEKEIEDSSEEGLNEQQKSELYLFHLAISVTLVDQTKQTAGPLASTAQEVVKQYEEFIHSNTDVIDKVTVSAGCRPITNFYLVLENVDGAEKTGKFGLELAREIDYPTTIMGNLLMLGSVYRHKGEFEKSLDYYLQSINVQGLPTHLLLHYQIRYVGYILHTRGELDDALKYYETSLTLFEVASSQMPIGRNYIMMGQIAYLKGEYQKSCDLYSRSLEIFSDLNHYKNVIEVLFHLIEVNIKLGKLDTAITHLHTAEGIKYNVNHPVTDHLYLLAKALILKESKRRRDKADAQSIFEKVYESKILNFEYTTIAMKNLCDLLIDEMGDELDQEIFKEAEELVNQMELIGGMQNIYTLTIDAILLKAQFDAIKGDLRQSMKQLERAYEMCKEKGLIQLGKDVEFYSKHFQNQFTKWDKIIHNNPALQKQLSRNEIKGYIDMALEKLK